MVDQTRVKRRIGRYFLALAVGGIAALSLLWVMQFLIVTGKAAITESMDVRFVDFVRVKREERIERKKEKPERPPEPEEAPPDIPRLNPDSNDTGPVLAVAPADPGVDIGIDSNLGDFSLAEGDYLPLVRVEPMYPRRAQSRGLEGYCVLELTVTPLGTTTDVRAIECSSSLFERASIQAAQKFRYKPRVVNGTPVAATGVRYRMTFQIED